MSCRQNCCNFCDNDLMHLLSQVVVIKHLLLGSLPPSPSSTPPPSPLMSPPRCHRLPFIEITAFITVNIFVCQFLSKITVQILQSQLTQWGHCVNHQIAIPFEMTARTYLGLLQSPHHSSSNTTIANPKVPLSSNCYLKCTAATNRVQLLQHMGR